MACEAVRQPIAGPANPRASEDQPPKLEQSPPAATADVGSAPREAEPTSPRLNAVDDAAWPPQRHPPQAIEDEDGLQILAQDCLATVHAGSIEPGRYPLPGRPCSEPLQQSWTLRRDRWLLAGQD